MPLLTSYLVPQSVALHDRPAPSCVDAPPARSEPPVKHDETLLVSALEEIENNRLALETLRDAGILEHCLDGH